MLKDYYKEVLEKNQCITLKDLAIRGKDLIDLGVEPGPQMGEILNKLLDKVLEEPELNNRDSLLDIIWNEMI